MQSEDSTFDSPRSNYGTSQASLLVFPGRTSWTERRAECSSMADSTIESQTYLNQRRAFCGSIKCPIRRLRFESITVDPRQLDPSNVARILEIFKLEGCRRLEPQNHVPALLSQPVFNALVERIPGGLNLQDQTTVLMDPTSNLKCLHGRHCIEAAKKYLHPLVDIVTSSSCRADRGAS